MPLAVEAGDEVGQRLGLADLLYGQRVRSGSVDDRGQPVQLGGVGGLVAWAELRARAEQVLQVPGADEDAGDASSPRAVTIPRHDRRRRARRA